LDLDQLGNAIKYVIAFILCTSVHEFGHAWVATRLGDPTPRTQGRLTLSPVRHIDPIGTVLVPLIMTMMGGMGFAWGRPVQTNPSYYTRRFSVSTGRALVAVAGPAMNLVMAAIVTVIAIVGARVGLFGEDFKFALVQHLVVLNLWLMVFNLLPIPPLDGGAVLAWALPRSMQGVVDFLNRWGGLILLGMLFVPGLLGVVTLPARILVSLWIRGWGL
jgi:Zn-dependent protease